MSPLLEKLCVIALWVFILGSTIPLVVCLLIWGWAWAWVTYSDWKDRRKKSHR